MRAMTYLKAHSLEEFAITETVLPEPILREFDVLVRVKAVSVNPVDYKIRKSRSSSDKQPIVLGWDASGVIEKIGSKVLNFKMGDEVFYAGELLRDGSNAELQAVDSRLIALKPKNISHSQAAAIPLTAITAYETLIEQTTVNFDQETKVLIIGGAGGVGSMSLQLLKALTPVKVYATASREESKKWCLDHGADFVLNHQNDLRGEMKKYNIESFDFIFCTTQTDQYSPIIPDLLRPFGHLTIIDEPSSFDIRPFKLKSLSVSWEFMFSKSMFNYHKETQGKLLAHVASLIEQEKIKSATNFELNGLNTENLRKAHSLLESGKSIGKIVINV